MVKNYITHDAVNIDIFCMYIYILEIQLLKTLSIKKTQHRKILGKNNP